MGINFAETQQVVQTFVDNFGVTFPVLLDLQGGAYNQYRPGPGACTSPFPLDFILDRDGIIRYWKCEYDPTAMRAVLEELLAGGPAELAVHDAAGRLVRVLATGMAEAGRHQLLWDGRDGAGRPLGSGVYFVRLRIPGAEVSEKVSLVR